MIGRKSVMGLMHLKPEGRWAGPRASQVTAKIPSVKLASDHTWVGGGGGLLTKGSVTSTCSCTQRLTHTRTQQCCFESDGFIMHS